MVFHARTVSGNIAELVVLVLAWQEFSQVIVIVPAKVYPPSKKKSLGIYQQAIVMDIFCTM
jgi:hypothetical protein